MIVELICSPIFLIIRGLILLFPTAFTIPDWGMAFLDLLLKALYVFPADVWIVFISNVLFWYGALFAWAIIEWTYKKIPGVT